MKRLKHEFGMVIASISNKIILVHYKSRKAEPWRARPSLVFSAIQILSFLKKTKGNMNGWGLINPGVARFAEKTNQATAIMMKKENKRIEKRSTFE